MSTFTGAGGDSCNGMTKMWELAKRNNKKPLVVRRRVVKQTERVALC